MAAPTKEITTPVLKPRKKTTIRIPAGPPPAAEIFVVTWVCHADGPERRRHFRTREAAEACMERIHEAAAAIELVLARPANWHTETLQ